MRHHHTALRLLALVSLLGFAACSNNTNTNTEATEAPQASGERWLYQDYPSGPYAVAPNWPRPIPDVAPGWTWSSFGGVFAETEDKVWIAQRGLLPLPEGAEPWTPYAALPPELHRGNATGNADGVGSTCQSTGNLRGWERRFDKSILTLDAQGNTTNHWAELDSMFDDPGRCGRGPHQVKISPYDAEKHVWIIDDQLHMIYKFTQDGELVYSHGEYGVPGRGPNNFARPTDIAWLPDGTYFISDGYDGKRVAKFTPEGEFIMDWGQAPVDPNNPGPSEFNNPHSIAISEDRRLFVVDRGHERMQVFDENGAFLDMWSLRSPHWPAEQSTLMVNHLIDGNGFIWVGDAPTARLIKYDLDGNYLYSWGDDGGEPGRLACSHGISTDPAGNLYIADCFAGRVQKFVPIPGSDPEKLVAHRARVWD